METVEAVASVPDNDERLLTSSEVELMETSELAALIWDHVTSF